MIEFFYFVECSEIKKYFLWYLFIGKYEYSHYANMHILQNMK